MVRIITDYLDETAKRFPGKTAFIDEWRSVTFRDFRQEARKIATGILSRNIFHAPVAIFLEKSVDAVACMLGVAYSGNFYTVIDEKMPAERIEKIIDTLKPEILITNERLRECIEGVNPGLEVICYSELMKEKILDDALREVSGRIDVMDILYVLFTSGSTGMPKGVVIGQRSVIDYTEWVTGTFDIDDNAIIGNQAPFHFDNSVLDIYQTIKNGATLHIISKTTLMFPARLMEYVARHSINMIFWVPSALISAANFDVLDEYDISCLKKVLFAGEVMPAKQLNQWRRRLPDAIFANLYGPTEITVDCTYYIVDREFSDTDAIPIGIPCRDSDVIVLNDEDQPVTGDERGELCVRGISLAYGYYKNPQKTAEVFVKNPLNEQETIYRTGDIVHYNERGEIMYDGRRDFQIKHMGYRIELGEIEAAASSVAGVDSACALYDRKNERIVLCYAGKTDTLRKRLGAMLPGYMVPKVYEKLDAMPLNPNGKIDRKLLAERFTGGGKS